VTRPTQPRPDDPQLEIAELRAELARQEDRAADKERQLERYAADLRETFKGERARTAELHRSYMATVRALANAVEARDAYTGKHAERVSAYALLIAQAAELELAHDREIEFGFLLHDVGKVAVPDAILFKPGRLTHQERLVIRHHHERFDGTGYPDRLTGEDIPLSARVFAVADVLDALTTERPYRQPSSISEARGMIEAGSGAHFDPAIIEAFRLIDDATLDAIRTEIS
jgi:response regulator RpfG family c-di-GMP phosphodiesterase